MTTLQSTLNIASNITINKKSTGDGRNLELSEVRVLRPVQ